jgi:hypothetical protein
MHEIVEAVAVCLHWTTALRPDPFSLLPRPTMIAMTAPALCEPVPTWDRRVSGCSTGTRRMKDNARWRSRKAFAVGGDV